MRIKTKLSLGVGFLFFLIILMVGVSVRYISALANDTQKILVANYNTIDYSRQMLISLDKDLTNEHVIKHFEENLFKQQNNITEQGEKELTDKLAADFENLKNSKSDKSLYILIRRDLTDIMLLNMQAIERKSAIAQNTAKTATSVVAFTGAFCFILAFTLLLKLPGSIANPIKELTNSIREIALKNYSKRVNFESNNEFGDLANSFNTMAQKLEEYNSSNLATLMMEKKRIETLINNMKDPVIGLDDNQRIIFINNEALKITGLKLEEVINKLVVDVANKNDLVRTLIDEMESSSEANDAVDNQLKIFADGKESYFKKEIIKIEIVPTAENQTKHIGNVILLQNITPFKELDVAKTNFIATVSHEFKTPISSIKMSLQLLENDKIGSLNDEQKSLLNSINEDSNRLLKFTTELLNITQVESGNIHLSLLPANCMEILNYAVNATKTQADQKNIQLVIEHDQEIPKVFADSEKTAWVLTNLISNAVRYSYDNSKVLIKIERDNSMVKFIIKDTGPGISKQYKNRIFERYFQVPGSNKEGTGLGLAISKEFVEAQGGRISLESDLGTGSTFTISLNALV